MNLLSATAQNAISILNDPFSTACITDVDLHWSKNNWFNQETVRIYASVRFKHGDTEGRQKIEAATMDELLHKVKVFIETLPKGTPKPSS